VKSFYNFIFCFLLFAFLIGCNNNSTTPELIQRRTKLATVVTLNSMEADNKKADIFITASDTITLLVDQGNVDKETIISQIRSLVLDSLDGPDVIVADLLMDEIFDIIDTTVAENGPVEIVVTEPVSVDSEGNFVIYVRAAAVGMKEGAELYKIAISP